MLKSVRNPGVHKRKTNSRLQVLITVTEPAVFRIFFLLKAFIDAHTQLIPLNFWLRQSLRIFRLPIQQSNRVPKLGQYRAEHEHESLKVSHLNPI